MKLKVPLNCQRNVPICFAIKSEFLIFFFVVFFFFLEKRERERERGGGNVWNDVSILKSGHGETWSVEDWNCVVVSQRREHLLKKNMLQLWKHLFLFFFYRGNQNEMRFKVPKLTKLHNWKQLLKCFNSIKWLKMIDKILITIVLHCVV